MLKRSDHLSLHVHKLLMTHCKASWSWAPDITLYSFVSSAKNWQTLSTLCGMPLVYIINRIGPRMDPWGTPDITSVQLDVCPLTITLYSLPFKKLLIHDRTFSVMPYECTLVSCRLWGTVSKALSKPKQIVSTCLPSSRAFVQSSRTFESCSHVTHTDYQLKVHVFLDVQYFHF